MSTVLPAAPADLQGADYEVSVVSRFSDMEGAAEALRGGESASDLFSTWAWFDNLAQTGIEPGLQRLLLLVRHRASGGIFCLPLLRRQRGAAALFGTVVASLSNYYSSLYGPIGQARHFTVEGLRAAVAHLRRHHRPCAVIDLQPLDTNSPFYAAMQTALRAEGYLVDSYFCFGNWHLEVAGRSFAAYESAIPSRLRNTIQRGRKKLDAAGAWTLQVQAAPGPQLTTALADFDAIYAKSWKVPEPFPHFVGGLCRTAAASGWLRLGVVRFEDKPIAAQLWLVKDRHASIYKLAYDEAYERFSAGSVLSAEMMRRVIDDEGVVDVDYLTGDEGYKVDWMSHRRERRGLVAFDPRSWQGLASAAKHHAGRAWARRKAAAAGTAPAKAAPEKRGG